MDPNPMSEEPSTGIPTTALNIRCSKNVALPAAVNKIEKGLNKQTRNFAVLEWVVRWEEEEIKWADGFLFLSPVKDCVTVDAWCSEW